MSSETDDKGTGKVVWWGMAMLSALILFGITGWVKNVDARVERLNEAAAEQKTSAAEQKSALDLLRYRLDRLDAAQSETNAALKDQGQDVRAVRRLLEGRR